MFTEIAKLYNVEPTTIRNIIDNKTWTHIEIMPDIVKPIWNNTSKLTEKEVKEIRELYKTGKYTRDDICKLYNVYKSTISKIVNYKTWKHI